MLNLRMKIYLRKNGKENFQLYSIDSGSARKKLFADLILNQLELG